MTAKEPIGHSTIYLPTEGREQIRACMDITFNWCAAHGVSRIVVFTATGEGPLYAAQELLTREEFTALQLVAVSPPVGRPYRVDPTDQHSAVVAAGVPPEMKEYLAGFGIAVVSAHLPFKEIHTGRERESEWARVAEAFGVLGGGFSLCIQAAIMACDAGEVHPGERVVSMSADTAIVVRACRTENFLSPRDGLLVEHIICRPATYTVSKAKHHVVQEATANDEVERPHALDAADQKALPAKPDQ